MTDSTNSKQSQRKWIICGMLLLALVLNYMDRQTLANTKTDIKEHIGLTDTQYGNLEFGFGLAFAAGGLVTGLIADRVSIRWMYPAVLLGWSVAGVATGFGDHIGAHIASFLSHWKGPEAEWLGTDVVAGRAYLGFMVCRVVLGFFEAGQWPCALITTQRLLSRADRSFGNSILQSGASIGAIITPIIVEAMVSDSPGSWRGPYTVIGCVGLLWIGPWLWFVSEKDVSLKSDPLPGTESNPTDAGQAPEIDSVPRDLLFRRIIALAVVVITINMAWQFFRAWLPSLLREFHHYTRSQTNYFTIAYYVATDLGCISAGFAVKRMVQRGFDVHISRMAVFVTCALLTGTSAIAATLPAGPLLLALLLVIGFGMLGLFPNYYSFSQELSSRHQGAVTGTFGCLTWCASAVMQKVIGRHIDLTKSYADGIFWIGLTPLLGAVAMLLLWGRSSPARSNTQESTV